MKKRKLMMGLKLDVEKAQDTFEDDQQQLDFKPILNNEDEKQHKEIREQEKQSGSSRTAHDDAKYLILSKLDENLFISNLKSAQDVKLLTKDGITHIINLISHKNNDYQQVILAGKNEISKCEKNQQNNIYENPQSSREKHANETSPSSKYSASPKTGFTTSEKNDLNHSQISINSFNFQNSSKLPVRRQQIDDMKICSEQKENRIKYLYLSMRDQVDCDITFYLYAAIDFIEQSLRETENKAKILIHCYKGNSRSAAIAAGYLMWRKGLTDQESIEYIRLKRGFIDPNLGFVGQLMELNKKFKSLKSPKKIISPFLSKIQIANKQYQSINESHVLGNPYIVQYAQKQQTFIQTPRIFTYTSGKERILVKNYDKKRQNTLLNNNIFESEECLDQIINKKGSTFLIQLKNCFFLVIRHSSLIQDNQFAYEKYIERGIQTLLKLAQYLIKYEKGPLLGFIFRDQGQTNTKNKFQVEPQLVKIPNLSSLKLDLPYYQENSVNISKPPQSGRVHEDQNISIKQKQSLTNNKKSDV